MQKRYTVVVGSSWGSLPPPLQDRWTRLRCDAHASVLATRSVDPNEHTPVGGAHTPITRQPSDPYERALSAALASRSRHLRRDSEGAVVVAVCVSVTTRKLRPSRLEQLSLFTIMLPSMLKTLSHINTPPPPATGGRKVEIWVYVGYDAGDPFFDRPGREQEVEGWIQRHLVEPLRAAGTDLQFVLLRFQNHVGKPGAYPSDLTPSHLSPCHPTTNRSSPPHRHPIPGPAFNFLTRAAFDDGAHSRGPNTAVGSARDQCDQCALPRSQPVGLEGAHGAGSRS